MLISGGHGSKPCTEAQAIVQGLPHMTLHGNCKLEVAFQNQGGQPKHQIAQQIALMPSHGTVPPMLSLAMMNNQMNK